VRSLLNIGADPNEKLADNGNTPLHEAVKVMKSKITQNNKEIVQCLLEKGADASIKNNQNKNVL
jgi:ankyrin repeat protein